MPDSATAANRPMRTIAFDAKEHARLFRIDGLALSTSAKGNPRLLLEVEHDGGLVRAGTITYVPPSAATLGGGGHAAALAVHGRMAEFSDAQIQVLTAAGVRVVSEAGRSKVFRTLFIDLAQVDAAMRALAGLTTANGKPCFKGAFTANAIGACLGLLRAQGVAA